jgi:hypothetical protein
MIISFQTITRILKIVKKNKNMHNTNINIDKKQIFQEKLTIMSYKSLIDKFAAAYPIIGIYIHDAGRIIALNQKNPRGLLVLRENSNKLSHEGNFLLESETENYGLVITQTPSKSQLVLLIPGDKLESLAKHWSRILPAVLKTLPVEEIVEEESPTTQLARISSRINELFDEIIEHYKDISVNN